MPSMIGCHALVFTGEFDTRGMAGVPFQRARAAGFDLIEFPAHGAGRLSTAGLRAARRSRRYGRAHRRPALGLASRGRHQQRRPLDRRRQAGAGSTDRRCCPWRATWAASLRVRQCCTRVVAASTSAPASATGRASSVGAVRSIAGASVVAAASRLALEVVNRYESNVLNTGQRRRSRVARRVVDSAGRVGAPGHLPHEHRGGGPRVGNRSLMPVVDARLLCTSANRRAWLPRAPASVDFGRAFRGA